MYPLSSLKHLSIDDCPNLTRQTIPPGEPSSNSTMSQLEYLRISSCDSPMSFLFAKGSLAAVKTLNIYGCKGLESLEECVVESLNSMSIYHCENLQSLPRCLYVLSHLTQLYIEDCPELQMECFASFLVTLSDLTIDKCPNFNSLPDQWHHLSYLQTLTIRRCENIECFPKGSLPPNLLELTVDGCENLKQPVREWGLHMLKSLEYLEIDCSMGGEGEKLSFPSEEDEDGWSVLFPSSLTSLWLNNMSNVERLSSGLRNHLSSLEDLRFEGCPKLRYLPEDGFSPSLRVLRFFRCEMLKDRCSKLSGEYWHLIQEIPYVRMGDDRIQ